LRRVNDAGSELRAD